MTAAFTDYFFVEHWKETEETTKPQIEMIKIGLDL